MTRKAQPDGMLVTAKHLTEGRKATSEPGVLEALTALGEREPALAGYLSEGMAALVGKLSLAGAPTDLVRMVHHDALLLTLSSLEASRRASYELWEGTTFGTLLEKLAKPTPQPEAPPKKKPRGRKGPKKAE
jgi:hypothetical protein